MNRSALKYSTTPQGTGLEPASAATALLKAQIQASQGVYLNADCSRVLWGVTAVPLMFSDFSPLYKTNS